MKDKLIIIIICLLVTSGCSATYNVEIKNNTVIENFAFIETNEFLLNNQYVKYIDGEDSAKIYSDAIKAEFKKDSYALLNDDNKKYKKELITKDGMGISYNYTFNLNEYKNSGIANNSYKYFNVLTNEKDTYIISTDTSSYIFDEYEYLDNLEIHLKTNHKVKSNNADRVDGYNYYWKINRSNYSDKRIYIELYKDKYVFNYDNYLGKVGIVILSIAILSVIVIIFFRHKTKKNNKI